MRPLTEYRREAREILARRPKWQDALREVGTGKEL